MKRYLVLFFLMLCHLGKSQALEVTFISNEGFLFKTGDNSVLIDALYRKSHPDYTFPSEEVLDKMIHGTAMFEKVDLYLQSHVHYTHFYPETVGRFLDKQRDTRMIASPQVVDSLAKLYPDFERIEDQLLKYNWEEDRMVFSHGGVRVDAFKIRHDGEQWAWVQNLGHLIHIGRYKILHMGDLLLDEEVLTNMRLNEQGIDLAILPFWLVLRNGVARVKELIKARKYIISHYPIPRMKQNIARIKQVFPEAIILNTPMKTELFQLKE